MIIEEEIYMSIKSNKAAEDTLCRAPSRGQRRPADSVCKTVTKGSRWIILLDYCGNVINNIIHCSGSKKNPTHIDLLKDIKTDILKHMFTVKGTSFLIFCHTMKTNGLPMDTIEAMTSHTQAEVYSIKALRYSHILVSEWM